MPTLACKNSTFLHIPKCAGSAMCHALGTCKISRFNYTKLGIPHACIDDLRPEDKDLPRWTIIRHPSDWLRSFFAYRWQSDWPAPRIAPSHPLYPLISFRTKDIGEYVDHVVKLETPITKFFQLYIDHNTTVLRIEKFSVDLDKLLVLEPEFDHKALKMVNPTNRKEELTDDQKYAIWMNEQEFFQRFYACYYPV